MNNEPGDQPTGRHLVNWRSGALVGLCVAGGLTLNMMVLGAGLTSPAPAATDAIAAPATAVDSVEQPSPVVETLESGVVDGPDITTTSTTVVLADAQQPQRPEPASPVAAASPAPVAAAQSAAWPSAAPVPTSPPAAVPTPAQPAPVSAVTTPPAAAATTAPPPTAPPKAAPTTAPPTAAPATTPTATTAPPQTVTYRSYGVNGVGTVHLAVTDNRTITVYSVERETNWVFQIDKNGPTSIEVKFFNVATEREAEFHAEIDGGNIKVENG